MASLVLSTAGAAVGGALFGPAGAIAGRIAGAVAGSMIDQALLAKHDKRQVQGPRLADLDIMASTEGAPIPRVYGRVRLSGQVIWATRLEEVATTSRGTTSAGGGKGMGSSNRVMTTTTTYAYYANIAVGLCEGPIGRIARVWADGKPLDLSGLAYRTYTGSDTQTADPLILAKEGASGAPAYRGLAYIVFERFPLANFGNRVPQLSFEVVRPIGGLEEMVRSVTLIPGTTEFGYEPSTVVRLLGPGQSAPENRHVATHESDIEASLDELQAVCPNLEQVAVVVAWFGDDLRANHCTLKPGVDSAIKSTHGATWSVAGLDRASAHLVSTIDDRPAYGGTPSDQSVINLITELKARGLKVMLYPFVMMDIPASNTLDDPWSSATSQPAYPWRGRITCDPAPGQAGSPDGTSTAATQVNAFFGTGAPGEWSYRRMVMHYADLAMQAGGVDAFMIGSELKSLTRVRSASGVYPAVDALVSLASAVRTVMGSGTKITYGADWIEYGAHVVDSGANEVRFPLDKLWASSDIDAIGIDYYAPLADWRDGASHADRAISASIYDRDYLSANLRGGEAYDWYYADHSARDAQTRSAIIDGLGKPWIFRAKDLWNWWSNAHIERVGGAELASPTDWTPQSKPIWLTEFGCPAVDKGANQPSSFPDSKSADGGLPVYSNGRRDDLIQRRVIEAVLTTFDPAFGASSTTNPISSVYGGSMIDPSAMSVWTWDARPYPAFPAALDIWSDGVNWATGHWLTGRLGSAPMPDLVAQILDDMDISGVNTSGLGDGPDGYIVDRPMSARAAIEPLSLAYAFDAVEEDGVIRFRPRGGVAVAELIEDDLVLPDNNAPATLVRAQETELPRQVSLAFTDGNADFRRSAVIARRLVGASERNAHADLAIVTNSAEVQRRADIWLQDVWAGRESVEFALPMSHLALVPGDVVDVDVNGRRRLLEINEIVDTETRRIKARTIDPDIFGQALAMPRQRAPDMPPSIGPVHARLLDLPTMISADPPVLTWIAIFADPWPGAVTVYRSSDGLSFDRAAQVLAPAIVGETLAPLSRGATSRWDDHATLQVRLYGGALASASDMSVLGGVNAAAVQRADGAWEVLQFANADLVGDKTYNLSRLLRGQAGSEWAMGDPLPAGSPFVLLDENVIPIARGLDALARTMQLRVIAADRAHGDPATLALELTPSATSLRPLTPVHLYGKRTGADVRITFIRRTRRDGDNWASIDVPLGEDQEAYAIEILSGTTIVRTLTSITPEVLYAAADEIADFGAPQSTLAIRVAQVSSSVGRGFEAEATLSL